MSGVIERYEGQFARFIGSNHAFSFWKGRVALYALLRALGVGEGDDVILPGYTCVMDVNPIKYVGARPVYVDMQVVYSVSGECRHEVLDSRYAGIAFTDHCRHTSIDNIRRSRIDSDLAVTSLTVEDNADAGLGRA